MFRKKYILYTLIVLMLPMSTVFGQTTQWRLIWEDPNPEDVIIDHYNIYRSETANKEDTIFVGSRDVQEFVNDVGNGQTDIARGNLYYYWVRAVNNQGIPSNLSDSASAALPLIKFPPTLMIPAGGFTELNLDSCVIDPDDNYVTLNWSFDDSNIPSLLDTAYLINKNGADYIVLQGGNSEYGIDSLEFTVSDQDTFMDTSYLKFSLNPTLERDTIEISVPDMVLNINDTLGLNLINPDYIDDNHTNILDSLDWDIRVINTLLEPFDIDSSKGTLRLKDSTDTRFVDNFNVILHASYYSNDTLYSTFNNPDTVEIEVLSIVELLDNPYFEIAEDMILTLDLDSLVYRTLPFAESDLTWNFISGSDLTHITIDSSLISQERQVSFIPDSNWFSLDTIEISYRATDLSQNAATATLMLSINPINDVPVITISEVNLDSTNRFFTFHIDSHVVDVDSTDTPQWIESKFNDPQSDSEHFIIANDPSVEPSDTIRIELLDLSESYATKLFLKVQDDSLATDSAWVTVYFDTDPISVTIIERTLEISEDSTMIFDLFEEDILITNLSVDEFQIEVTDSARYLNTQFGSGIETGTVTISPDSINWCSRDSLDLDRVSIAVWRIIDDTPVDILTTGTIYFYVKPVNDPPIIVNLPKIIVFNSELNRKEFLLDSLVVDPDFGDSLSWDVEFKDSLESIRFFNKSDILSDNRFTISVIDSSQDYQDYLYFFVSDGKTDTRDSIDLSIEAIPDPWYFAVNDTTLEIDEDNYKGITYNLIEENIIDTDLNTNMYRIEVADSSHSTITNFFINDDSWFVKILADEPNWYSKNSNDQDIVKIRAISNNDIDKGEILANGTIYIDGKPVNDAPIILDIPSDSTKFYDDKKNTINLNMQQYIIDVDDPIDSIDITIDTTGISEFTNTVLDTINKNLKIIYFGYNSEDNWEENFDVEIFVTDPQGESDSSTLNLEVDPFLDVKSALPGSGTIIIIDWDTRFPAQSYVSYGIDDLDNNTTRTNELKINHQHIIEDLKPGTKYQYQAAAINANDNLYLSKIYTFQTASETGEINVFPNPFKPNQIPEHEFIYITNMPEGSSLSIYNMLGEPVYLDSDNSERIYRWKAVNKNLEPVQSGLYIYIIKDRDNKKLASGKIVIIR